MKNCERCFEAIPSERLEILPETRLCVHCSEEIGGDYDLIVVEENIGTSVLSKPIIHKVLREIEPRKVEE